MSCRFINSGAVAVVLIGAGLVAPCVRCQTGSSSSSVSTPRTPDGKPDLSGVWMTPTSTVSIDSDVYVKPTEGTPKAGELTVDSKGNYYRLGNTGRCAPNQIECNHLLHKGVIGTGNLDLVFQSRANPNRPLYKPEYWDKVQDLDYNSNVQDPMFHCDPPGVPRVGPPTKILQTPNEVILLYSNHPGVTQPTRDYRLIPTDGRAHNPERFPTYQGDSVGMWEGDTLVVDSVNFVDNTWLAGGLAGGGGGYFHSYDLHVIERFRRQGNTLRYEVTVEDPTVLLQPWVLNPRELTLNTDPNVDIPEGLPCKDYDSSIYVNKQRN
jgi:hypothetical protein